MHGDGKFEKLTVGKDGSIRPFYRGRLYDCTSNAAGLATIPFGAVGFIADTVLSAGAGAVDPAYAFDRPVEHPSALDRTKGFAFGAIKSLPGGFLITDITNHGGEVVVSEGTELDIQLKSDLVIPM